VRASTRAINALPRIEEPGPLRGFVGLTPAIAVGARGVRGIGAELALESGPPVAPQLTWRAVLADRVHEDGGTDRQRD
jgi:hypothetical protein